MNLKLLKLLVATSGAVTFWTNICGISFAETKQFEFNFKKYDFWVEKCKFLKDNQQYHKALNACERAITLKPKKDNTQLWLTRGDVLLQLSQFSEAAISYDWVLKEDKKNVVALAQKCSALLGLGKYEDALKYCNLALEKRNNWENIKQLNNYWGNITLQQVLYVKGSIFRKLKEYDKAIDSFNDALKQNDNFALAYAGKCGIFLDQKDPKKYMEASELCEKAVDLFDNSHTHSTKEPTDKQTNEEINHTKKLPDTTNAIIWYETGRVKQRFNKLQEALNNFNIAIQVNPKHSQALAHKSEILNKMERYQEALDECDRALKGDNQWSDTKGLSYVWYQRSAALLGLKKYNEALASSERRSPLNQNMQKLGIIRL